MSTATVESVGQRDASSIESVLDEIDNAVRVYSALDTADYSLHRSMEKADLIDRVKHAMSAPVVRAQILKLKGSRLGFLTDERSAYGDRKEVRYAIDDITDALAEGLLRGARLVGNEINIISRTCYLTVNFFRRVVEELLDAPPKLDIGTPKGGNPARVPCKAVYVYRGEEHVVDCTGEFEIPVRTFSTDGPDMIIGKARRKLLARVHERLTGKQWGELDDDASTEKADAVANPITRPRAKSDTDAKPQAKPDEPPSNTITETQRKRLFAEMGKSGRTHEQFKDYLLQRYRVESTTAITVDMWDDVLEWCKGQ